MRNLKTLQKPLTWAVAAALLSVMVFPMSHPAVAQQHFYTVQSGDTLSAISVLYGVSVEAVAEANDISNPDLIVTGQSLSIPGAGESSEPEVVWEPEPESAGVGNGQPGYTVQSGDTLGAIAELFGVSVSDLADHNGVGNLNLIVTGQSLAIPGAVAPVEVAASAPVYLDYEDMRAMFHDAAAIHGEDPYLMMALAWQESGWQQDVVSWAGAVGIMQLMPETAAWAGPALTGRYTDVSLSAWDNIETGVAFYAHLYSLTGSDYYALAGYYQGPYSVETDGLFDDTEAYVTNILEMRDLFAAGRMP